MSPATVSSSGQLADRLGALFASKPEAMAESQVLFKDLREQAPVFVYESAFLFSRHSDARTLARDEVRLNSAKLASRVSRDARAHMTPAEQRAYEEVVAFEAMQLVRTDRDEHDRLRGIAHRAFTPSRIAALEESVKRYTDELLATVAEDEVADLMTFAYTLPLMVICDLLGVPHADRELIHSWSAAIGRNKGAIPNPDRILEARAAIGEFQAYVEAMLEEYRRSPLSTDLVAALMDAEQGDRLTAEELTAMFVNLLFAGHETTTNLIGVGLLELLRARDQWEVLCAEPTLAGPATEELLRFVTPVQWQQRVAATDFEHGGVIIPEGELVFGMLAGANRDPDVFEDPERLDIRRTDSKAHLALGFGPHFCLGASLARLEGRIAFDTLARRFPQMELATDVFQWRGSALLRSLERLPVALGADGGGRGRAAAALQHRAGTRE